MPRRRTVSRRRLGATATAPTRPVGWATGESAPDGEWLVRAVPGAAALKPYRCPGCDQLIPPGTAHVVAWPVQKALLSAEAVDERRHWHTACWRRRP